MTESGRNQGSRRSATVESIRNVAGHVPEETIAALLDLQPTDEELEVAAALARGEGDIVARKHYSLTRRIHRIFDMLTSGDPPRGRRH